MHAGDLIREWRQRRRLSQLDLAIAANVSSRHLSFVETGRSRPTSEMILHLAEHLDVPLRDRNALLLAGGFAPAYPERGLAEPELQAVRDALTASDVHQAVTYRPITRYEVPGGYLNLPGLTLHDPNPPAATHSEENP